jgi:hypothetical protein
MPFDLDDPDDLTLFVAAVDDDDERPPGARSADAPEATRQGCGCGCVGCLLPVLAMATSAGLAALPLAGVLGLAALVLALLDHRSG